MQDFEGDNDGYLKWIAEHPNGYVLNLGVRPHTSSNPRINQMVIGQCASTSTMPEPALGRHGRRQVRHCTFAMEGVDRLPNRTAIGKHIKGGY